MDKSQLTKIIREEVKAVLRLSRSKKLQEGALDTQIAAAEKKVDDLKKQLAAAETALAKLKEQEAKASAAG